MRLAAPLAKRAASPSVVLPTLPCPSTTTLRMSSVSNTLIAKLTPSDRVTRGPILRARQEPSQPALPRLHLLGVPRRQRALLKASPVWLDVAYTLAIAQASAPAGTADWEASRK